MRATKNLIFNTLSFYHHVYEVAELWTDEGKLIKRELIKEWDMPAREVDEHHEDLKDVYPWSEFIKSSNYQAYLARREAAKKVKPQVEECKCGIKHRVKA